METTKIQGIVYLVGNEQVISPKFKKRELIVQTQGQHPQYILIQFSNDKCDLLNNLKPGEAVQVNVNLRGRLWTNPKTGAEQCFTTIEAWSIQFISHEQGMTPTAEKRVENYPETPKQPSASDFLEDELPF
jgi:single-stranded DNA-binding protein